VSFFYIHCTVDGQTNTKYYNFLGIGILPGLESYTSDDSDNSSSSDSEGCERTDWVGRKVACKDAQHGAGC
jgi:hypothetical protein